MTGKRILCCLLAVVCAGAVLLLLKPTPAQAAQSVTAQAQKLVRHYRNYRDLNAQAIQDTLAEIEACDPDAGRMWKKVMEDWDKCNKLDIPAVLPDGLPEDDSLCIVVLGFELNGDGSMKPELIARLETALESAAKYPKAYIAVTGGGTAAHSSITEAEAMAAWLLDQGIEKDRLIVEKDALSTTYNAVNTYGILVRDYPSVTSIAIVTSDYHIPWGCTLFQTVCNYTEVYGETVIPVVAWAGNATSTTMDTMNYQASGISTITGIPYYG